MIGIIGGTGLYQMDELQVTDVREVTTPFGSPSSPIVLGILQGRNVAFLARHGLHHEHLPSEINYRGNIWALKSLGVRSLLGVSAVGSLRVCGPRLSSGGDWSATFPWPIRPAATRLVS